MSRFSPNPPTQESTSCCFSVATDFSWPTTRSCASRDTRSAVTMLMAIAVNATMNTQ